MFMHMNIGHAEKATKTLPLKKMALTKSQPLEAISFTVQSDVG